MIKLKGALCILWAGLFCVNVYGASVQRLGGRIPNSVYPEGLYDLQPSASLQEKAAALGLGRHGGLQPFGRSIDISGPTQGYHQTYRSIPLWRSKIILRWRNGRVEVSGSRVTDLAEDFPSVKDITPTISRTQALKRFKQTSAGKKWVARMNFDRERLQQPSDKPRILLDGKAIPAGEAFDPFAKQDSVDSVHLTIYVDQSGTPHLAYAIFNHLFDAKTFEVLNSRKKSHLTTPAIPPMPR